MNELLNIYTIWATLGLVNYLIKLTNWWEDWKKDGNRKFFILTLMGCIVAGPVGLASNLILSKGKPFLRKEELNAE